MRRLNIALLTLAMASAQIVYANCPPAGSITETNGKYSAHGLGGEWTAYGVPASGVGLGALQGAEFVGAQGSGSKQVIDSRCEGSGSICVRLVCKYRSSGGLNFSLQSPIDKQYKVTGANWNSTSRSKDLWSSCVFMQFCKYK